MQKVQTMLADTLSPLRDANFRTYMLGQSISLIGTWMQNTAQGWLVWQLTGSEQALGVVTALGFAPLFFVAPFAGVMSDRMDRRRVIIAAFTSLSCRPNWLNPASWPGVRLAAWYSTRLREAEPLVLWPRASAATLSVLN